MVKRMVCLANSRKLNGRCVAGIELSQADEAAVGWVRPVSGREHEEVSEYERQYQDGSDPRLLDVLNVPLLEPRPKGFQQENWLLDPAHYWVKVGRMCWDGLSSMATNDTALWVNGYHTHNGLNDSMPLSIAMGMNSSLTLVQVRALRLRVFAPGEAFGNAKRRVQGGFQYRGTDYRLWVTDPVIERRYLAQSDGYYDIDECFVVISLGEPFNGTCYKLVASIIERV